MGFRLDAQFMSRVPHMFGFGGTDPGEIRTGAVDGGNLQPFCFGLLLTNYGDVDPVHLVIAIGVEFRLDPKLFPDPVLLVREALNDLGLTVFENRNRLVLRQAGRSQQEAEQRESESHECVP